MSGAPPPEVKIRRSELQAEVDKARQLIVAFEPRMAALFRAWQVVAEAEIDLESLFVKVGGPERAYTESMVEVLRSHPEAFRQAQIAIQQYENAASHLKEAQEYLTQMKADGFEAGFFPLPSVRGAFFPLYNFALAFSRWPVLNNLFPMSMRGQPTQGLNGLPAATGSLHAEVPGTSILNLQDPQQLLSGITERFKATFTRFFFRS